MKVDRNKIVFIDGREYYCMHRDEDGQWDVPASIAHFQVLREWVVTMDTVADVVHAAKLDGAWDAAVPQGWWDASKDEMKARGGWAVWYYPKSQGGLFGRPYFADSLIMRACNNIGNALLNALEDE